MTHTQPILPKKRNIDDLILKDSQERIFCLFFVFFSLFFLSASCIFGDVTFIEIIVPWSISVIIFLLPLFLSNFARVKRWYNNYGFWSIISLFGLMVLGLFSIQYKVNAVLLCSTALLLLLYSFKGFRFKFRYFKISLLGSILMLIIFIGYYSKEYHSLNPFFNILNGTSHADNLFHCSISNMFKTTRISTLGLHGNVILKYHFFSHILMGSVSNLSNLSVLKTYNILYPALFIPLFLQSIIVFSRESSNYFFKKGINPELIIFSFIVAFGFDFLEHQPLVSESFNISIILSLFFMTAFIHYKGYEKDFIFHTFVFFCLLLISFSKISTGFLFSATIVLSALIYLRNSKAIWSVILYSLLLITFVYFFIIINSGIQNSIPLIEKLTNLRSYLALRYILGLFPLFYFKRGKNISDFLQKNNRFYFLQLVLFTLLGCSVIVIFSNRSSIYYFASVQIYLVWCYIIVWGSKEIRQKKELKLSYKKMYLLVVLISLVAFNYSLVSSSEKFYKHNLSKDLKAYDLKKFNDFITICKDINAFSFQKKKESIIYLSPSEKWLFDSQNRRPLAAVFIIPALTGVAQVKGISEGKCCSERLLYTGMFEYDFLRYTDEYKGINNVDKALIKARELGYKRLLYIHSKKKIELSELNIK